MWTTEDQEKFDSNLKQVLDNVKQVKLLCRQVEDDIIALELLYIKAINILHNYEKTNHL